jgi:hypothetical protein
MVMTKREIKDLIKYHKESKTYYAKYAGYGIHGTDLNRVVEQLNALICQIPGCGNPRCEKDGRVAYLCPNHFSEACRESKPH